jgi:hypothetical protein
MQCKLKERLSGLNVFLLVRAGKETMAFTSCNKVFKGVNSPTSSKKSNKIKMPRNQKNEAARHKELGIKNELTFYTTLNTEIKYC